MFDIIFDYFFKNLKQITIILVGGCIGILLLIFGLIILTDIIF